MADIPARLGVRVRLLLLGVLVDGGEEAGNERAVIEDRAINAFVGGGYCGREDVVDGLVEEVVPLELEEKI